MSISYHLKAIAEINESQVTSRGRRYSFFPIVDETSYKFYKRQEAAIWSANELEFDRDIDDFNSLPTAEKHMLCMVLAFFAVGDGLVSKNLVLRFLSECVTYEETAFFTVQLFIELVHSEAYSLFINSFMPSEKEREELFRMVDNDAYIKDKADFMEKYIFGEEDKAIRFVAAGCFEGIFFSPLFAIIFFFRSIGILQNLIFTNEQVAKDEGLHLEYMGSRFKKYRTSDHTDDKVHNVIREAVEIECRFISGSLPKPIKELSSEILSQYVRVVANKMCEIYECSPIYNDKMPEEMKWMDEICLEPKSLFHEIRTGSYPSVTKRDPLKKTEEESKNTYNMDIIDF